MVMEKCKMNTGMKHLQNNIHIQAVFSGLQIHTTSSKNANFDDGFNNKIPGMASLFICLCISEPPWSTRYVMWKGLVFIKKPYIEHSTEDRYVANWCLHLPVDPMFEHPQHRFHHI
jgi:hypothetical protein